MEVKQIKKKNIWRILTLKYKHKNNKFDLKASYIISEKLKYKHVLNFLLLLYVTNRSALVFHLSKMLILLLQYKWRIFKICNMWRRTMFRKAFQYMKSFGFEIQSKKVNWWQDKKQKHRKNFCFHKNWIALIIGYLLCI